MHAVARFGTPDMRQPGAGQQAARGFRMVDRHANTLLGDDVVIAFRDTRTIRLQQRGQCNALGNRSQCCIIGGAIARNLRHDIVAYNTYASLLGTVNILNNSHSIHPCKRCDLFKWFRGSPLTQR